MRKTTEFVILYIREKKGEVECGGTNLDLLLE